MIDIDIPGFQKTALRHLVLDFNGTLAIDGGLQPGVADLLRRLAAQLTIHVITADTFGRVREEMSGLPVEVAILPPGAQDLAKERYVRELGAKDVCAMGNGRNDRLMLAVAALGICLLQKEGAAAAALTAADVVSTDIRDALGLLLHPLRLTATLRS
jgi:soluble P-type ATPase